ncbi:unnamed protein product, partial [Effrenium voratum]
KLEEGLRRMDSRLERLSSLQSQCSEGLVEAKAAALSSAERSSRQAAELETRTAELKDQLKSLREELSGIGTKEAKTAESACQLARKQELHAEAASELRRLVEAMRGRQ